jgi:hypothetical protein
MHIKEIEGKTFFTWRTSRNTDSINFHSRINDSSKRNDTKDKILSFNFPLIICIYDTNDSNDSSFIYINININI